MWNSRFHSWLDDHIVAKIAFIILYAVFAMVLLGGFLMPHHMVVSMIFCLLFVSAVLVSRLHFNDKGVRFLYKRIKD